MMLTSFECCFCDHCDVTKHVVAAHPLLLLLLSLESVSGAAHRAQKKALMTRIFAVTVERTFISCSGVKRLDRFVLIFLRDLSVASLI